MRATKMLISTLKEAPNEAIIDSHILLLRAGMVTRLVSGVYNFMPLGKRVLNKIENIVRKNMDKAGALEILSSAMEPKELWQESGRWEKYGPELIRFKDRHNHEFCLGPTHEEVFTDIVRNQVKSYKNLPINIYQIQAKYRDEMRPRFGLIRSREFIMKDAYSFDVDEAGLEASYQNMKETYIKIFDECKLKYKIVLADTGAMGGSASHQFMALSNVGEGTIIYCSNCDYVADAEKASALKEVYNDDDILKDLELVHTPLKKSIEEVSDYLGIDKRSIAKALIYYVKDKYVMILIRGDREVNEIKVAHAFNVEEFEVRLASDKEIEELGLIKGYIGPKDSNLYICMDEELVDERNLVIGANNENYHYLNANLNRDFKVNQVADLRLALKGDKCACCHHLLESEMGTEVGQIFKLNTRYSLPMNCTYLDENGINKPMLMGCYGIGVTRVLQSVIDQYHDEDGIVWPVNLAPYHIVIVPVNYKDQEMKSVSDTVYQQLLDLDQEVILDDRDYKVGFKFKDWDLIGIPYMVIVGRRANEGIVELKRRNSKEKVEVDLKEIANLLKKEIQSNL